MATKRKPYSPEEYQKHKERIDAANKRYRAKNKDNFKRITISCSNKYLDALTEYAQMKGLDKSHLLKYAVEQLAEVDGYEGFKKAKIKD